jgi:hypothetical protein
MQAPGTVLDRSQALLVNRNLLMVGHLGKHQHLAQGLREELRVLVPYPTQTLPSIPSTTVF